MFKDNKIKKLLAFSILLSTFVFYGTSASGVVKSSSSFGGFDSRKVQQGMRMASSVGNLKETSSGGLQNPNKLFGTDRKLEPFLPFENPGIFPGTYRIEIQFVNGRPTPIFVGNFGSVEVAFSQEYVNLAISSKRGIEIDMYLRQQHNRVIRDNNS